MFKIICGNTHYQYIVKQNFASHQHLMEISRKGPSTSCEPIRTLKTQACLSVPRYAHSHVTNVSRKITSRTYPTLIFIWFLVRLLWELSLWAAKTTNIAFTPELSVIDVWGCNRSHLLFRCTLSTSLVRNKWIDITCVSSVILHRQHQFLTIWHE